MMTKTPYIGSGRPIENDAELVVRKRDFNAHAEGGGFKHTADMIDMNPPLPNSLFSENVQGTFEKFQQYLQGLNYVTIGDGESSTGDFTVGTPDTPYVHDCFNAAFALPQMEKGGVVLMKPGVYVFDETVNLPLGVSVLGHSSSTILSSGSGLNIGSKPMFKTPAVPKLMISKLVGAPFTEWQSDGYSPTMFLNLMFVDNYLFYTDSSSYPANPSIYLKEPNSAFIQMHYDSKVLFRDCSVIGKAKQGANAANTDVTTQFVRVYNATPGFAGCLLDIQNCIIHGVQRVVNFDGIFGHENTLKFINNKVWAMFKTNAPTTNYVLGFTACNAQLNNNFFKLTSMNLSTSPENSRGVCFYSYGTPSQPVDITITGNSLNHDSLSPAALTNQLFVTETGVNQRCQIYNNSTGGNSDSNWYITVGDGTNTIGDINGSNALNVISNIFSYSMNAFKTAGQTNLADQTTIYIRPGTYTINSTFNPRGIGAKLIGVKENENLPRINITNPPNPFSVTGWLMDTSSYIILGTHLENLLFSTNNSNYVRIASPIYFDNISSQEVFGNNFIAKNCYFYNVGLMPRPAVTSFDANKPNVVDIIFDSCRFGSLNTGSYTDWAAVYITGAQANYLFKNCVTEKINNNIRFSGIPIERFPLDPAGKPNLTIENCNFSPAKIRANQWGWLYLQNMGDIVLKNSTFDISGETVNGVGSMLFLSVGARKKIIIDNCKIIGNNIVPPLAPNDTYGLVGLNLSSHALGDNTPNHVEISNTEISKVSTGIYFRYSGSLNETNNVIIKNNRQVFDTRSSAFFMCRNDATNGRPFNLSISENTIWCNPSVPANMLAYQSLVTNGVINCACGTTPRLTSSINVDKNKIYDVKTGSLISNPQSAITIKGFHSSIVTDNLITMTRAGDVDGYVIDCQMVNTASSPAVFTNSNNSYFKANGNHITYTAGPIEPTTKIVAPIFSRNIHYVNIKNNTILLSDNINITNYIIALSNPIYAKPNLMDGIIENNIFNRTLKYEQTWILFPFKTRSSLIEYKEVLIHDMLFENNSRIRVENNKNQKAKYDISCTNFKQYGFNKTNPSATLLLKNADLIQSDSHVSNMNRTCPRIMQDTIPFRPGQGQTSFWDTLPNGLYYTNVWRGPLDNYSSKDPMVEKNNIIMMPEYHFQNQILIPLSSLPRDCEILNIDIPVYLQNITDYAINVELSCSFILGNSQADDVGLTMNYLNDSGLGYSNTNWNHTLKTLTGYVTDETNSGALILLTYNNFDTRANLLNMQPTNTNATWMGDSKTRLIANPDMYILLAINRIVTPFRLEDNDYLAFAIPYARVTIRY